MAEIRCVRESDYLRVAEICKNDLGYECEPSFVRNQIAKVLHSERQTVLVAQEDNNVVGYIQIEEYETIYFGPFSNVLGLAVADSYRNKGIGAQLIKAAEEWAMQRGAMGVRINSASTRKAANKFYEKHGYENTKEQVRLIKKFN